MLLQIHDELIFETPADTVDSLIPIAREEMSQALDLDVPLVVDIKAGDNWLDAEIAFAICLRPVAIRRGIRHNRENSKPPLATGERNRMETRPLGKTGLELTVLSYGASSLGAEFRRVDLAEALRSVHVAIDSGMNFIDTSPYYGRGMSEVLLGQVLPEIPRDKYYLGTKLGRYAPRHFDFTAKRVEESIDISLERMKVDYLDIALCHDIEFVDLVANHQ